MERKSVASSLSLLEELGYDLMKGSNGGVSLYSRLFDGAEVSYLVDAVLSSRSVDGAEADRLIEKIYSIQSIYAKRKYPFRKPAALTRSEGKETFYSIEIISEAIRRGKWVAFQYLGVDENGKECLRRNGYVYHRSPCCLLVSNGSYYLLCYGYKHKKIEHYHLDYLRNVSVMEERERVPMKDIDDFKGYRGIESYVNDHIYLFGGEVIDAEFELKFSDFVLTIKDWFGEKASIRKEGEKLIAEIRNEESALFYWTLQYFDAVKVLSPSSLVEKLKKAGEEITALYY